MAKMFKRVTILLAFLMIFVDCSKALATNSKIILFTAKWNLNSRKASQVTRKVAKSYGRKVELKELDIDHFNSADIARSLNLKDPV